MPARARRGCRGTPATGPAILKPPREETAGGMAGEPNRNSRLLESARLGSPSNAIATSAAGAVSAAEMALASVIESHLLDGRAQPQARPAHAHGCLGKEPYEEC